MTPLFLLGTSSKYLLYLAGLGSSLVCNNPATVYHKPNDKYNCYDEICLLVKDEPNVDPENAPVPHNQSALYRPNEFFNPDESQATGKWKGTIEGKVYNHHFSLPITVTFSDPYPDEFNPYHFNLTAGNQVQPGSILLTSAQVTITPSGKRLTLKYMDVVVQNGKASMELTDDQKTVGAAINGFIAPNVSVQSAPAGPGRQLYEMLGATEIFASHRGSWVQLTFNGNTITGSVQSKGYSMTGIFPTGDVIYEAKFTATRVQ